MRAPRWLASLLLVGVVAAVPALAVVGGRAYYLTQLTMAAYYSIVLLGLCLVMGYAGQVSLGHGAFFALGGYTSAILTTVDLSAGHAAAWALALRRTGILVLRPSPFGGELLTATPGAAFVCALLLTFIVALLIGYPALRLKGHYLAMATLGFGLIVYRIVLASPLTGGADGIHGVPAWPLACGWRISGERACRVQNYVLAWTLALLVLGLLRNLVHSRPGRALRAIHDGEMAANAMGVNTAAYKLQAFVLSALLAAAAGCFLTHYNGGIGPSEASSFKSVRYVALVAAGGMGNPLGVLVIGTLLEFLSLRGVFGTLDLGVFGLLLILIIALAPEGPLQALPAALRRRAARRKPHAAA